MTLSLPTLDAKGQFFGVTALDVHLELTFYEVAHFHLGKDSYAFLVGSSGKTLTGPSLPIPNGKSDVFSQEDFKTIFNCNHILISKQVF